MQPLSAIANEQNSLYDEQSQSKIAESHTGRTTVMNLIKVQDWSYNVPRNRKQHERDVNDEYYLSLVRIFAEIEVESTYDWENW